MMAPKNEVGRELKASELVAGTVVLVEPPQPAVPGVLFSMWVGEVTPEYVVLFAGAVKMAVINFVVQPGDTLQDDHGRPVHVFEYLGEI